MHASDNPHTLSLRRHFASGRPILRFCVALVVCCLAMALFNACTRKVQAELAVSAHINAIRDEAGVRALTPDATLVRIARDRSADMAARSYFDHVSPDGCDYVCLMDQHGVGHGYAGETIAWNTYDWSQTAAIAVQSWAKSPPHLANMVDCHFQRFGAGVAQAADGRIYITAVYEGSADC